MDFSRIFIFEPPDFLADFVAGFFSFLWVKVPRKILQAKYPAKSSKIYTVRVKIITGSLVTLEN